MTLTKADLIQDIAITIGLNLREAAKMIEAFFEEIADVPSLTINRYLAGATVE